MYHGPKAEPCSTYLVTSDVDVSSVLVQNWPKRLVQTQFGFGFAEPASER